jgi:hypothetical protein
VETAPGALKRQPSPQLEIAWQVHLGGDHAGTGAPDLYRGSTKLRSIEGIQRLGAELQGDEFLDLFGFENGDVPGIEPGTKGCDGAGHVAVRVVVAVAWGNKLSLIEVGVQTAFRLPLLADGGSRGAWRPAGMLAPAEEMPLEFMEMLRGEPLCLTPTALFVQPPINRSSQPF